MALTSQVQESYLKVQEKAIALQYQTDKLGNEYSLVKLLVNSLNTQLAGETPTSQEALRDKAKIVDAVVIMLHPLKEPMISEWSVFAEIDSAIGELQTANQNLERLLSEASDRQTTVAMPVASDSPDSQIASVPNDCFLQLIADEGNRGLTQQLLDNPTFTLASNLALPLTAAWGAAMQSFIDDAQRTSDENGKALPGRPETIDTFFCVRSRLVTLYNRLALAA